MHMRKKNQSVLLAALLAVAVPGTAVAQRANFERTFDVAAGTLDVSSSQGAVDVRAGTGSRIVVKGSVAVRIGWDVPANAAALVRAVADHPPVTQDGQIVRVQPPTDADERRAVTISYVIEVPTPTAVRLATQSGAASVSGVAGAVELTTQSGATNISDVTGAVNVTTQSAALTLRNIGGAVTALSQSGAVAVDGTRGALSVTTQSSAFTGHGIGGALRVRTKSGEVNAAMVGPGAVDVETGSSRIRIQRLGGAVRARSNSGRIILDGRPGGEWDLSTGSGAIEIGMDSSSRFRLDAATGSGSVTLRGAHVQTGGVVEKKAIRGDVGSNGPVIRANSRSGSVTVDVARQ